MSICFCVGSTRNNRCCCMLIFWAPLLCVVSRGPPISQLWILSPSIIFALASNECASLLSLDRGQKQKRHKWVRRWFMHSKIEAKLLVFPQNWIALLIALVSQRIEWVCKIFWRASAIRSVHYNEISHEFFICCFYILYLQWNYFFLKIKPANEEVFRRFFWFTVINS